MYHVFGIYVLSLYSLFSNLSFFITRSGFKQFGSLGRRGGRISLWAVLNVPQHDGR